MKAKIVLVTGAGGYIGRQVIQSLKSDDEDQVQVIAMDIKEVPEHLQLEDVIYIKEDIRSENLCTVISENEVDTVVHLASIVTPGKESNREFEYSVDVKGTENILKACVENQVNKFIVTSSGAAYGYHADHPNWLTEEEVVRGNEAFAYAYHKRLVEEMLAEYRMKHPQLQQTIFRIGTILGEDVNNQITNLFKKRNLLGIKGSKSPFVFIWDQDVVQCICLAIKEEKVGVYNVAGDGAMTIEDISEELNKRVVYLPGKGLEKALYILKKLKATQYGPEQVDFLRYRPVLDNTKLKQEFGYSPIYTSKEVFLNYIKPRFQKKK